MFAQSEKRPHGYRLSKKQMSDNSFILKHCNKKDY